ncbi:glycosyltransferase [Microbacterium tenebrionis]|uniref:glycosyltransferase n=1 Tax=Microbacterium tenebrionis TaxID=2830665 RepID=UPI00202B680A|nr:glycosyltransferase [Microbacterium ihumii]
MPTRVHAIIVARPGPSSRAQLLRTLDALTLQTRRPDAVTLVVCGDGTAARESDAIARVVEGIIEARTSTSFAEAVALAKPRVADDAAIWLLAHDTAPHPGALAQLAGALERSPSASIAAPKLVDVDDDRHLVSLGVTMTRWGRSVELAAGELDQNQHDGRDDALGADIRGMLIRAETTGLLLPDPGLGGADEGLDLGVRARLAGGRVTLAPGARVSVSPDGPAALPQGQAPRAYVTRLAQLHRRLAYAPAAVVPLHWLSLLPLALWRTIAHLVAKRPASVFPEWGAALAAMVRFGAVARSRRGIRTNRKASWARIAPLRISRAELRRRLDDGHGSEGGAVSELDFFSGGGAWAVLGALVVSIAAFTTLLAWPAIGGGALLPLRDTVAALWSDARGQ